MEFNRHSFSLAFLLVGLPILFTIREFLVIDKYLFTYIVMFVILAFLPNFKRISQLKLIDNKLSNLSFLFLCVLLIFLLSSVSYNGFDAQAISLLIIVYLIISLSSLKNTDFSFLIEHIFILSFFTNIISYALNPTSIEYWIMNGGRFYVGDTNNPNLTSWVAVISIMSAAYIISSHKKKILYLLSFINIAIAMKLYFLSFSKSSAIGIILLLIFYIFKYKKSFFKIKILATLSIITMTLFYYFYEYLVLLMNAYNSLLGFDNSNMSGSLRNEGFRYSITLLSFDNIFGYGINTFRMDSPILQATIDFGNIIGVIMLIYFVLYPILLILQSYRQSLYTEYMTALYIFFIPNIFFHGTPYEWMSWLPTLLFYSFSQNSKYIYEHKYIGGF